MKKDFRRAVLIGLFTLSVGVAGAVFAEVASATPLLGCNSFNTCNVSVGCPGQPCECRWSDQYLKNLCLTPVK